MRIINRYIGSRTARGWILVTCILVALFSVLELVEQLNDVGEGSYRIQDALLFVVYTLPGRTLQLLTPSILLGGILALGNLDSGKELLAMRASGFSPGRIAGSVLRVGIVVVIGAMLAAQFAVPALDQEARLHRELALSKVGTLLPSVGFWTLDENRFIKVKTMLPGDILGNVEVYEFGNENELKTFTRAEEAFIEPGGRWVLSNVTQSVWSDQGVSTQEFPRLNLDRLLTLRQVNVLALPPETLSLTDLVRFVGILEERGQSAERYRLVLWQKLTLPLSMVAMILLSVPFAIGKARQTGLGWRILLGSILGIGYYFLAQALGYLGLLMELNPVFITVVPSLFILALAGFFWRKIG